MKPTNQELWDVLKGEHTDDELLYLFAAPYALKDQIIELTKNDVHLHESDALGIRGACKTLAYNWLMEQGEIDKDQYFDLNKGAYFDIGKADAVKK